MEILLSVLYAAIFILIIWKIRFFRIPGVSRRILVGIFIIKIMAGIGLTMVYTHYYKTNETADVFKYFEDGKVIYSSLQDEPSDYIRMVTGVGSNSVHLEKYYTTCNFWYKHYNYKLYNDNRTIIRFNAFIMLFSFGYFTVHTVFMAFLAFLGLTAILKVFIRQLYYKKYFLIFGIYLIPTALLHSSAVLKEGLLVFAFGIMLYYINRVSQNSQIWLRHIIFIAVFTFLLLITKIYVLLAAVPGLITLFILNKYGTKFHLAKFVGIHIIIVLIAFNSKHIIPSYDFPQIIAQKQHDFVGLVDDLGNVGSQIELPPLKPNGISIIENTPNALFNSFFRPHLFEADNLMMKFSALENFMLLLFFLLCLIFISLKKIKSYPLFYFSLSFGMILFIISGLTTPVLGALVRYKGPGLIFIFIAFLFLMDYQRLIRFTNKIIKPFNKEIKIRDFKDA